MAEPIEWRVLTPPNAGIRWGLGVLVGLVLGGGLALPAIAAVGTMAAPRGLAAAGIAAIPVAVGGGLARYRRTRKRTPFADALAIDVAGLRWLPPAGLVAAGLTLLVPLVGDRGAINLGLLAVAVGAAGFVAFQVLRGAGRFDPETGTASFEGRMYHLSTAPTTPIRLGGLTLLVVRRPVPDPLRRYGLLAMPTRVYADVQRATP